MMELTKHFFFTISLLLILQFLYLIWISRKGNFVFSKTSALFCLIASVWICCQFAYQSSSSLRFDLREVPIVIGGLYLGIGPLVAIAGVAIRSLYGIDSGFYASLILYVPLALLFSCIYPWIIKQLPKKRMVLAVTLTICISLIKMVHIESVQPFSFDIWFAYLIVLPLSVFIMSYIIEFAIKSVQMHLQLIKAEKLKAVEHMGAAMSHEIRNPLTSALGFVQLLLESPVEPAKRKQYLSLVKDELESAERVIKDYLTFSKSSLAVIEIINIKQELRHVISILQPMANQYSVTISTNFALAGLIKGDRQKFHQCFINLLKNGIESMPDGGHLSVETAFTQTHVTVQVRDTGIGMTDEQVKRLGEPYYSTKGSKGTGLGMMVAYGIIQSMKGSIVVHSEIGKGSCFQIKFPTYVSNMEKDLSINDVNRITETDQSALEKKKWYRTKADNIDPLKELSGEKTMK